MFPHAQVSLDQVLVWHPDSHPAVGGLVNGGWGGVMFHLEMSFPAPGGRGDLGPCMEAGTWVLSFPKPCVLLPSVIVIRTKFDLGRGKADALPPHPATSVH